MFTLINMKTVCGLATLVSLVLSLPQTTRPPIPTESHPHPPPDACLVDGKIYLDGASISRDPDNCYGSVCNKGSVNLWDDKCFLTVQPHCDGQLVDIPGQCCHECRPRMPTTTTTSSTTSISSTTTFTTTSSPSSTTSTTTSTPSSTTSTTTSTPSSTTSTTTSTPSSTTSTIKSTPSTTPSTATSTPNVPYGACIVDGHVYMNGETISRDPENCYFSRCSGGSVMYGDERCFLMGQPHCNGQLIDILGQCCHDGHVYSFGEDIIRDREHCYGMICEGNNQFMNWDDKCFLNGQPHCPNGHLVDIPGQCCDECIEDVTTVPPSAIVG